MSGCKLDLQDDTIPSAVALALTVFHYVAGFVVIVSGVIAALKNNRKKGVYSLSGNKSSLLSSPLVQLDSHVAQIALIHRSNSKDGSNSVDNNYNNDEIITQVEIAPSGDQSYMVAINNNELQDHIQINNREKLTIQKCLKVLLLEIWHKKSCYLPFATQILDQASNIGVLIKFYLLYHANNDDDPDACFTKTMSATIFYSSLFSILFYRIVSSIWIFNTTKSLLHTILQLFDFEIYHKLYLNFITNTCKPHPAQSYIQMLHVTLETFFQLVIQVYYLIAIRFSISLTKSEITSDNNIVFISLIFCAFNIALKMTSEDQVYFISTWRKLNFRCNRHQGLQFNCRYLIRLIIRLLDVFLRVLFLVIIWVTLNDVAYYYIAGEIVILSYIALTRNSYVKPCFI